MTIRNDTFLNTECVFSCDIRLNDLIEGEKRSQKASP